MAVTNEYVQKTLGQAVTKLIILGERLDEDPYNQVKVSQIASTLNLMKSFSISSNGIPALRGKGLEPCIRISEEILMLFETVEDTPSFRDFKQAVDLSGLELAFKTLIN